MAATKRRITRQIGLLSLFIIVSWWIYDHIFPIVPPKAYEYLPVPDIDEYIPEFELEMPQIELDYHQPIYNKSKVALLIENRPLPMLAPLMLHMMSVVPPDWRFRFMGSEESINHINTSAAIVRQVEAGKLDLTYIPTNMSVMGQEMISQFLTNLWLYEVILQPAEWLLLFQTDSILCANSLDSLDNYLDYDWVGAPWWTTARYGGNGGLSLRRVSSIIRVLQHQERRNNSEPEDVWLSERLGHLPNTKTANGTVAFRFSGEMNYVQEPMGYHTGSGGLNGGLFGTVEKRKEVWDYCPELKMHLDMDIAGFMGEKFCNTEW